MKEITDEEFYKKIEDVIEGRISRNKLVKELETDSRTLNNKIQKLSVYNPELYSKFIEKFPYKSKSRDDIDFEALAIEIVKRGMTMNDVIQKYDVGERTVRRRIKEIFKNNSYLYEIYNEVKNNNKHSKSNRPELQQKIDELVLRPVKVSEINEIREKQLEEIESTFNKRCEFVSKEEAARTMGMTANRIYKLLNELYRIRIEKENAKKSPNFKDTLKFNSSNPTIKTYSSETNKLNDEVIEKEGEIK